jgi:hypothetical protein
VEDDRIWEFERNLWVGEGEVYERCVADDVVMALPAEPFLFDGAAAKAAVEGTPRWESVEFAETRVSRPEEGLIVIGYRVRAQRGEQDYHALCTSTLQRCGHEDWRVVQHQQTPLGTVVTDPDAA